MLSSLLVLMLAPALGAEPTLEAGTQLTYRGSVAQTEQDRTTSDPEKTFDVTFIVGKSDEAGTQLYWTVEERGRGAWPWPERFGSLTATSDRQPAENDPAVLYDLGDSTSPVHVPLPLMYVPEPLAAGVAWSQEQWNYQVEEAAKLEDRDTWRVQVSNNYGPQRVVWVEKDSPVIVGVDQKVFMGMGMEYQLQLRLVNQEKLDDEALKTAIAGFDALIGLRASLERPARTEEGEFSPEQLKLLEEGLPAVEEAVADGPLAKLARSIRRDLSLQSGRANAMEKLVAAFEGQAAPEFSASGLGRDKLTHDELKGHVTVLHFWDYRDAPLKEPYGQVGYLDFLHHQRAEAGLQVYGVAVDERLEEEESRGTVLRGVRKLKEFMNLSYPILLDGGEMIKAFGDPRTAGADLPLFVVVGPDGQILHYHVGFYEVDRNQGLKELNAVVAEALKR